MPGGGSHGRNRNSGRTGGRADAAGAEWFARPDPPERSEPGLRFECTMCGNCCTGPPGYVLVSDEEVDALARRFCLSREDFLGRYTTMTSKGLSLTETQTEHGFDCVFLDRQRLPGRAVCGVYEDRPVQCRTWPFWPHIVHSAETWRRTKRTCPGMDQGPLTPPQQIRILRDKIAP